MYRVAICDDEPHAAEQNEAMLCHILEDRNLKRDIDYSIHCFSSPVPLLTQMEKRPSAFHLLLLDIKLENDNGLSLAAHLREIDADCSIIYITAYRDYVFDCFDTRPLHYLLKPVDQERLARVIERDLQENYHPEQIRLLVDGCWQTVDARNVLYAEATSHKSAVHLQGGEVLYINQNFSDLLPRLNGYEKNGRDWNMRNKKLIPFEVIEKAVAGEPEVVDAVLRHYTAHIKYLSLLVGSQEDEISNFPLVFLILKVLSFLQNHFLGRFHSDCLLWIRIHL